MQLELQNIGMIKEATVKIDGLTVIAGENDTGKSTVGKALYYKKTVQKSYEEFLNLRAKKRNINTEMGEILPYLNLKTVIEEAIEGTETMFQHDFQEKIFYFQLDTNSLIKIKDKKNRNTIFIDTPILANFFDFFSMLDTVQNEIEYEVNNYPYLSRSLFKQLRLKLKTETTLDKYAQINILKEIIGGELKTNSMGDLVFVKNDGSTYPVNAVATGIKNFGILQLLLKNNYLTKDAILIVDEPEVHLHPKWQLKYAEFVVNLVQNGVKIIVNSHSPYMIEALQRYSERANIPSDFYLAEDGYISKVEDSNSQTLSRIFEKLSEPFDVFDAMDSESLQNG